MLLDNEVLIGVCTEGKHFYFLNKTRWKRDNPEKEDNVSGTPTYDTYDDTYATYDHYLYVASSR